MSEEEPLYEVYIDEIEIATVYQKSSVGWFIDTCLNGNLVQKTITIKKL